MLLMERELCSGELEFEEKVGTERVLNYRGSGDKSLVEV